MKTDQIQMNTPGEKKIGEYEFNLEDFVPVVSRAKARRSRKAQKPRKTATAPRIGRV